MNARVIGSCLALAAWLAAAPAEEPGFTDHPLCPLVLHQIEAARLERDLAVELAEIRLRTASALFGLVDELRGDDAVDRITHLTARHARDAAHEDRTRERLLRQRVQARLEIYRAFCDRSRTDGSEADRRARQEAAWAVYRRADCDVLGSDLAIAEIDLRFFEEVLASVRDLRTSEVATRQDVLRAEQDVDAARVRVMHFEERRATCAPTETTQEK